MEGKPSKGCKSLKIEQERQKKKGGQTRKYGKQGEGVEYGEKIKRQAKWKEKKRGGSKNQKIEYEWKKKRGMDKKNIENKIKNGIG